MFVRRVHTLHGRFVRALSTLEIPPPLGLTHEVFNQAERTESEDLFEDHALTFGVHTLVSRPSYWDDILQNFGNEAGSAKAKEDAARANLHKPVLRRFTIDGHFLNGVVEYDPGYHETMRRGLEVGLTPSLAWRNYGRFGSHVARAVSGMIMYQLDPGASCPLSMTYAAVPALCETPKVAEEWVPRLVSGAYDPSDAPASAKRGVTMGMSMTEKQGGSDVAQNTTTAEELSGGSDEYVLRGHKWFTSAPMCDAFLTLARVKGDKHLSCFLVPRWLPDHTRNIGLQFQQLKNKLGDHSNASSEVHYDNAYGQLIGERGRGVPTIIHMVQATRQDCAIGSAALMRQAVRMAVRHTAKRSAFGATLLEAPLMRSVLTDLAFESELAVLSALGISALFDDCDHHTPRDALQQVLGYHGSETKAPRTHPVEDPNDAHSLKRLLTAAIKYHVCKQAPTVVAEALECLGGNGFVEDFPAARMYRQAPLNSIWEGSGNVQALDILRTAAKDPAALPAFLKLVAPSNLSDSSYRQRFEPHYNNLLHLVQSLSSASPAEAQASARALASTIAFVYQAWLVANFAENSPLFDLFYSLRLAPTSPSTDVTLPRSPAYPFGAFQTRLDPATVEEILCRARG